MRPLLLLLAAASVFAADTSKLRIYELAKPGESVEIAKVPALAAEAYARPHTTELPAPVYRLSDIPFLGADRKEKLDLYFPAGPWRADRPAVVFIHGGGFTGGDKAEYRSSSVSADLCRAGYVVVSCNYVLGP
jgi:acetyl esterase/lipase